MSPFKNYNIKDKLFDSISSFPETKIIIGNDVSIGEDVLITKNVQIGNGAVIAAKSVLIHDVPPYAIVIGNPATIVSYRYSKKEIEIIEKIKWWNWSTKKIIENIHIFKMTKNELNKELERIIKKYIISLTLKVIIILIISLNFLLVFYLILINFFIYILKQYFLKNSPFFKI